MRRLVIVVFILMLAGTQLPAWGASCYYCHDVHGGNPKGIHRGGVARCDVCHTMHNSQDGAAVDPDQPAGNPWLLRQSNSTDICLNCHAGYVGDVFGSDPLNPPTEKGAGNFVFLLEENVNDGHGGGANPVPGHGAGHNVVSPDRGVAADPVLTTAPGGTFPSEHLACTSCHDPHGNPDFRMLYGAGREVQNGLYAFTNPAPDADGLSIYHGRERTGRHTAYRGGVSAWCGNCHEDFHQNETDFVHPSGIAIGQEMADAYNGYDGTDDPLGGVSDVSYLPLVPFEDADVTVYSTEGPGAESVVMCLTCHRAHASSARDAGRWDFSVTYLVHDGVESGSYAIPDPYDSPNQRSLCNKCHVKDLFDGPNPG